MCYRFNVIKHTTKTGRLSTVFFRFFSTYRKLHKIVPKPPVHARCRKGGGFRQSEKRKRRADPFLRLTCMCAIMLYNIKAMKEGLSHANPLHFR